MQDEEITLQELSQGKNGKEYEKQIAVLQEALLRIQEVRHYVIDVKTKQNIIRFALIGDLHRGSFYERNDALNEFYRYLEEEKIGTVLIAGDVLDGHGIYRGQEFEQYAHGFDQQLQALTDKHPGNKYINTYFITGNHDYSFKREAGLEVGKHIEMVTGWKCAGADVAWLDLRAENGMKLSIGLYHPDGGTSYAISYKSQKIVEQIPGGKKPNIIGIGHFHKAEYLPRYRNVACFQVGCFQSQTPFMARKPTDAHVGGWIIEVVIGDHKHLTSKVKAEFVSFYEPEEKT